MSEKRSAAMGKIQAMIDGHAFTIENPDLIDEDIELDQAASVQSSKELLEEQRLAQAKIKTETDIVRLEEAKRKASSQAAKDKLDEEIRTIKAERIKAEDEAENSTPTDLAKDKIGNVGKSVKKQVDRVSQVGKEAWTGLSNVATPGSIFLPVSVLIVFFLLLLPVNGHTRIEWLWLALTGNAHLEGETVGGGADFNSGTTQGGGADFGTAYTPVGPTFTGPSEVF